MGLPGTFQFSQSSLQDYESCPRRFKLRYLQNLRWPAIESEPVEEAEQLAQLGRDFHRLVHQHLIGLDEAMLTKLVEAKDTSRLLPAVTAQATLQKWWRNYLQHSPLQLSPVSSVEIHPELTLSASLRGHRLLARFDVLACRPAGTFLIIDWKTSQKKTPREVLAQRIQTRVYPYVLAVVGTAFNQGQPVEPAAIKMMYWFPQFPNEPEIFDYSLALKQRDEQLLSELIEKIKQAAPHNTFPQTDNKKACTYCVYRSLCDRGVEAGPQVEQIEANDIEVDLLALEWDQIAEIQF